MTESSTDSLETKDPEKLTLEKIPTSERIKYLKGSAKLSSAIFFRLECENWEEFIQLLETIHRFDFVGKSPSMPISITMEDIKDMSIKERNDSERDKTGNRYYIFTALSGLTYPTLLFFRHYASNETIIVKLQFLTDCGYVVIKGKLSFANIKGE